MSNYAYGSYYGLTNKCLPKTIAITDNTKFNVGTLVKIYIEPEMNKKVSDCNELTNRSYPNDIKSFDKNKRVCLSDELPIKSESQLDNKLESQLENKLENSCKSCSVEDY